MDRKTGGKKMNGLYETARNALISKAEKIAEEKVKVFCQENKGHYLIDKTGCVFVKRIGCGTRNNHQDVYSHCMFSQFFHEEMNRLAKENGLVS
jgi:hypothetical protein